MICSLLRQWFSWSPKKKIKTSRPKRCNNYRKCYIMLTRIRKCIHGQYHNSTYGWRPGVVLCCTHLHYREMTACVLCGLIRIFYSLVTVGDWRQVTADTRLPRWRQRKTRIQARPLLTMLQGMDRCEFWYASMYWIGLTSNTVIFGHHAPEWPSGALVFSGGRRVT